MFDEADEKCGGDDCDDGDARAFSGRLQFFDTPRARGGYDFNCDATEELRYETTCTCPSGQALTGVPNGSAGCGKQGELVNCHEPLLQARQPNQVLEEEVIQGCR